MEAALAAFNRKDWKTFTALTVAVLMGVCAGKIYHDVNVSAKKGTLSPVAVEFFALASAFVNGVLYSQSAYQTTEKCLLLLEDLLDPEYRRHLMSKIKRREAIPGIIYKAGKFYLDMNFAFSSASFLFETVKKASSTGWAWTAQIIEMLLIGPVVSKTLDGAHDIATIIYRNPDKTETDYAQYLIEEITKKLKKGTDAEKTELLNKLNFLTTPNVLLKIEKLTTELKNACKESFGEKEKRLIRALKRIFGDKPEEAISMTLSMAMIAIYGPSVISDIAKGNQNYPLWLAAAFPLTSLPTYLTGSDVAASISGIGLLIILTQLTNKGTLYAWNEFAKPLGRTLYEPIASLATRCRGYTPTPDSESKTWRAYLSSAVLGGAVGLGIGYGVSALLGTAFPVIAAVSSVAAGVLAGITTLREPAFGLHLANILLASLSVISSIKFAEDGAAFSGENPLGHYIRTVQFLLPALGIITGITFNSTGIQDVLDAAQIAKEMGTLPYCKASYTDNEKALVMAKHILETLVRRREVRAIPAASTAHSEEGSTVDARLIPNATMTTTEAAFAFLKAHTQQEHSTETPSNPALPREIALTPISTLVPRQ